MRFQLRIQQLRRVRQLRPGRQTLLLMGLALICASALAGPQERAKFIYDRIAGVPPVPSAELGTTSVLSRMTELVAANNISAAADIAMASEEFYGVTLKTLAAPWTNREQTPFVPLDDYVATFIGVVRDDLDLRRLLWDDILYVSNAAELPAYSRTGNEHYVALEANGISLSSLALQTQSSLNGLPSTATAGVLTSRSAAQAFFIDGTNRAMLRFTLMNHLCVDLEQLEDITGVPDRIRQDISRSPGGDSRLFNNGCVGCHTGMDPLSQAFAYYDYDYADNPEQGQLVYTAGLVQAKYHINADNFPLGYRTPDDQWANYWREGPNQRLGWAAELPGTGQGASSMGRELAGSEAFAQCQVEKVFKTVCLRAPADAADRAEVAQVTRTFQDGGYRLKPVFAATAEYCSAGLN
ncbi:MAG: hypothetical protein ACI96P_001602 [Candidatus Azotimanducaceae bacterium]